MIEQLRQGVVNRGIPKGIIAVKGSSHIGGHEFAGTAIVYPHGDWYGRLASKTSTEELLDHITSGNVYKKCWRGNGFRTPNIEKSALNW